MEWKSMSEELFNALLAELADPPVKPPAPIWQRPIDGPEFPGHTTLLSLSDLKDAPQPLRASSGATVYCVRADDDGWPHIFSTPEARDAFAGRCPGCCLLFDYVVDSMDGARGQCVHKA